MPNVTTGVQRIDKARIVGSIKRDDGGALRGTAVVARAGILTYFENGKTIRELVRPEELAKADSIESLKMKPVTLDHPSVKLVTPQTYKQFSVGLTGENVNCDDGLLYSSMTINDNAAIQAVDAGKRELSCGYICDLKNEPGTWTNGERYDREQVNRRYNHVAICDLGRAGSVAALHLDSAEVYECGEPDFKEDGGPGSGPHNGSIVGKKATHKTARTPLGTIRNHVSGPGGDFVDIENEKGQTSSFNLKNVIVHDSTDNSSSQRSRPMPVPVTIKGIVYNDQAPEVAAALSEALSTIETVRKDSVTALASIQTKLDAEKAAHTATQTKLDAANAKIANLPAEITAAAKARAELVAVAKPHLDSSDAEKIDSLSDAQIKIAVAQKAFPAAKDTIAAVKIDNADAVNTWYIAALSTLKNDATDVAAAANRAAVNGDPTKLVVKTDSEEDWQKKQLATKHDAKGNREQFLK